MGLDSVELVIAVEEEFGILISDREAERLKTVGDLVKFVDQALRNEGVRGQGIETALDEECQRLFGIGYDRAPRNKPLNELHEAGRLSIDGMNWCALGLSQPQRPRWLKRAIFGAGLAAGFGSVVVWPENWVVLFPSICIAVWGLLVAATVRSLRFDDGSLTYDELVERRAIQHSKVLVSYPTEATIFDKVRDIVMDQLSVKREQVTRESRFIEDLGVG